MPKLTRLRHSLRKTAKWGGLAATFLLCTIWLGSGWWSLRWITQWGGILGVARGSISIGWVGESPIANYFQPCLLIQSPRSPPSYYTPGIGLWDWDVTLGERGVYGISFPAWFPLLLTGTFTALAWRADLLARRRALVGKCIACGYSLDGLPPNTPCPECGRNPKAQSAAAPRTEDGAQGSHSPPR